MERLHVGATCARPRHSRQHPPSPLHTMPVDLPRAEEVESLPLVYIIVLNWNGWRDTVECIRSIQRLTYPAFRLLVVDNGSIDGSEVQIQAAFPGLELIQTGSNLGYAGGNNVGIRRALECGADLVWVLNNDTVVAPDCLTTMVEVLEACPRIGAVGATALHPGTGRLELARSIPYPVDGAAGRRPQEIASILPPGVSVADYVDGSCMLIRRHVLEDLAGFDPRYFHFWEDVDFCWRARRHGWIVAHANRCTIQHQTGSSTAGSGPMVMYYSLRNLLLFAAHANDTSVIRIMFHPRLALVWLSCLFGLRGFLHPPMKLAVIRAIVDATRNRSGRNPTYSPS